MDGQVAGTLSTSFGAKNNAFLPERVLLAGTTSEPRV